MLENASQNVDKLLHAEAKDWPPILVVVAGEARGQNGDASGSDWREVRVGSSNFYDGSVLREC